MEGKWFAQQLPHAMEWGQRFYGNGGFRIVQVQVSAQTASRFFQMEKLDGIGPAMYAQLPQINGQIMSLTSVYP